MSDVIGAFLRAERGHQRAGNAASVTGSREDFHLQVDAQRGAQTRAPRHLGRSQIARSDLQAASLVDWTSRTLLELAIGIARGFIASGISRTRSMCKSPFSRLAPLTCTWSASWKLRSKFRAAMPWYSTSPPFSFVDLLLAPER